MAKQAPKPKMEVSFVEGELLPAEPPEEDNVVVREHWEQTLEDLANRKTTRIAVPRSKELPREKVLNAFHDAAQLIGGTPRLALWANENPTEFYKLYAKLLPKQIESDTTLDATMKIMHVLPRGKLDE